MTRRLSAPRIALALLLSQLALAAAIGVAAELAFDAGWRIGRTAAVAGGAMALLAQLPLALWLLRDPAASRASWALTGLGAGAILTAPMLLFSALMLEREPFGLYWLAPFAAVLTLATVSALLARLILRAMPGAR